MSTGDDLVYLPRPVQLTGKFAGRLLAIGGLGQQVAGHQLQRHLGFWLCWHALGGLNGMQATGLWSRAGVYLQLQQFRETYGCSPDELLPELAHEVKRDAAEWPDRYEPRVDPGRKGKLQGALF